MGERIGIIGAGPSGLTAAYELGRRGYDAVVFEASDRVGGKCWTRPVDGARVELGAVIAAPGYREVLGLAEELGVAVRPGPRLRLVDLNGELDRQLHVPPASTAGMAASARLVRLLARHRRLAAPGYGDVPAALTQTIAEFLEQSSLSAIRDALVPPYTGYGYGYEDEIPAAYLLKMLFLGLPSSAGGWRTWLRAVRASRAESLAAYGEGLMFEGGYQRLWRAVAERCDVRLQAPVDAIDRRGARIRLRAGGSEEEVDRLIVAIDPRAALAALGDDADADEREALSSVRYLDYYTVLCRLAPPPEGRALFMRDNATSSRRGRPVICAHTWPGSDVCNVYVYGRSPDREAIDRGAIVDAVATDMGRLGHELREVVDVERWRYFPHLSSERIAWFYQLMEARQGHRRTWFLGEVMSFTTVESVVRHAKAMVDADF